MRHIVPGIALLTVIAACPLTAMAEDLAVADALFKKGLEDMEAGKFDTACPAIGESMRLDPRPGTLFTLAECEGKAGKIATAVARYEDYLQLFARLTPAQQKKQLGREQIAAERKNALSADVPLLTLVLPPNAPPGTRVIRDGVDLAAPAIGLALPVDPGQHLIVVQVPDQPPSETKITIAKKEKKTLTLEIKIVKVDKPPPKNDQVQQPKNDQVQQQVPPDTGKTSGRRMGAYVVGGIGIAGVAVGAVTGAMVFGKKGTITGNCHGATGTDCNQTGLDAVNSAKGLGTVSTIAFIAGGAAVVTGVILFATEPKKPAKTGNAGRWVSAGIAPSPDGALAHLQGVW